MKHLLSLGVLISLGLLPGRCAAETGRAVIAGTATDSPIAGEAVLTETNDGLRITATVHHAPPGMHGFHIHEFGSCEDEGNAAGSHYNPEGAKHGDLLKDGVAGAHAGDLGNLVIARNGTGTYDEVFPELRLSGGSYTVGGRSLILHASPDDFGQPTGNAGKRIACGMILITGH